MSVNELAEYIEAAALEALYETKALRACPFHSDVAIRVGNHDAERHAYALATTVLKRKDERFLREDLMDAIKQALDMAADGECPQCDFLKDQ